MCETLPSTVSEGVASLSDPAYVGENRCWPCTVLNLCLLGVAVFLAAGISTLLAAGLAVVGSAVVALRGYLVPYTPRFAPRLLAAVSVSVSKGPTGRSDISAAAGDVDGETVLAALVREGVVREESALVLDPDFHDRWRAEIDDLREATALVEEIEATLPGVAAERHARRGEEWFSLRSVEGEGRSESLSYPVALADVGAVRAMTDVGVAPTVAVHATRSLRQFLATCPACEGDLSVRDDACCGGFGPDGPDRVLACADCQTAVFAFE